ncbi:hypothetical protein P2318_17185 [Myxococcaceae bacterium GXIMD 01537]
MLLLMGFPGAARAGAQTETSPQAARMAREEEELLERVIVLLRASAKPGETWPALLDEITLDVPVFDPASAPLEDWEADARATIGSEGERRVTLSQLMALHVMEKGQAAVAFRFSEDLRLPPEEIQGPIVDELALEVRLHTLAWLVAHEIGHHQLQTVGRKPRTREDARRWELEADRFAWTLMWRAGFSLPILQWYFGLRESVDEVVSRNELSGEFHLSDERLSTHPNWSTRLTALDEFMNAHPPLRTRWNMLMFIGNVNGAPLVTRWMLPGGEDEHLGLEVPSPLGSAGVQVLGIEATGTHSANVYQRDAANTAACQLMDRDAYFGPVRCRFMTQGNARDVALQYIRGSFSTWQVLDTKGLVSMALGLGTVEMSEEVLRGVVSDATALAAGDRLIEDLVRRKQDAFLRYSRGDTTQEQLGQELLAMDRDFHAALQAQLGPEAAAAFQRGMQQRAIDLIGMSLRPGEAQDLE